MSTGPSVANDSCGGRASNEIIKKNEARAKGRRGERVSNRSYLARSTRTGALIEVFQ
jgi:hypothetical protein